MIEVHPGLFVGDESDALATAGEPGWFVVHACKEPHHRAALGYTGKGAPKGDPEYLVAHRPGCVALNLIDAPEPELIPAGAVMAGVDAIATHIGQAKVLVHCNQGRSRSPLIALLYLCLHTDRFDDCDYDDALDRFRAVYPPLDPGAGMAGFVRDVFAGGDPYLAPQSVPPTQTERQEQAPRAAARTLFSM